MSSPGKNAIIFVKLHQKDENDCDDCDALKIIHQISGQYSKEKRSEMDPASSNLKNKHSAKENNKSKNEQQEDNSSFWEPEPPPDIIELGRAGWTTLHTMAAYYPQNPSDEKKAEARQFLTLFARLFPCKICAKDFEQIINQHPPRLDSQKDFSLWLCEAHNHVNQKLGKPNFDCNKVDERWRAKPHKENNPQNKNHNIVNNSNNGNNK
jgi:FAD-linked sulfhydryl oxidase